jgi:pimeloyl-ACP methyl ester carboxylesterase
VTLLFVHGAGFTGEAFADQVAAFSGSHAPHLPGHGSPGEPQSIAQFADFLASYIDERKLRQVVLCGHSMGGAVALELALRRHPALAGLVVIGGGARLRVAPAIFERMEADFEEGARFVASFFFADPSPERIDWAVAAMQDVGQAQTLRDFHACDAFDALDRLGEVALPLLAVTGEHDKMTPPKFAQAFADRVPGAQARILQGAGHFAMVERPAETNAAIAAFLRGIA